MKGFTVLVPKTHTILARAIEEGVAQGYRRAHKHTEAPTPEHIRAHIEESVVDSIYQVFDIKDVFEILENEKEGSE